MHTSRTTRLLCAAAALIATLTLFSGVVALGDDAPNLRAAIEGRATPAT
jgi:hypothetical protein